MMDRATAFFERLLHRVGFAFADQALAGG